MRRSLSDSLVVIWQLAALEARRKNAPEIEPRHLLVALCRSVDLDLPALLPTASRRRDAVLEELLREVRRLRAVFSVAGLDARAFRHALRERSAAAYPVLPEAQVLHRSKASRQAFANAAHLAEKANSLVYPLHLFYALISMGDEVRDDLLEDLGLKPAGLQEIALREITPPWVGGHRGPGRN